MTDKRLDYPMMEEMIALFRDAAAKLEETDQETMQVASAMEGGALLGKTGDSFCNALRVDLHHSLAALQQKMEELANDIQLAIDDDREGVAEARSRFS